MKTMIIALMSSILGMLPYGAAGKEPRHDIEVTAQHPALKDWTARTGELLSQTLRYPTIMSGPQEGVVAVKFLCSETGAPSGVALLKSSGSRQLDNAAMRGVIRIKSLHPLPSGMMPSQQYVATILFANDQHSYVRQIRQLEKAQQDGNRWFDGRSQTLALGIGLLGADGRVETLN